MEILFELADSPEAGGHGLSLEDVKQAWLTVPRPKRGSGIKHEEAVVQSLFAHHQAQAQAQEAGMEGLTMMQVLLVKEILRREEVQGEGREMGGGHSASVVNETRLEAPEWLESLDLDLIESKPHCCRSSQFPKSQIRRYQPLCRNHPFRHTSMVASTRRPPRMIAPLPLPLLLLIRKSTCCSSGSRGQI